MTVSPPRQGACGAKLARMESLRVCLQPMVASAFMLNASDASDVHKMHAHSGSVSQVFQQMRSNIIQENDHTLINLMTTAYSMF